MNILNFSKLLLLTVVLALAVTGCKSPKKGTTNIPNAQTKAPNGGDGRSGPMDSSGLMVPKENGLGSSPITSTPGGIPAADRLPLDQYDQDRMTFRQQTVYFDLDRANVKPSEVSKIEAVASQFKTLPGMALLVEGHCDERGTPEYNRSLGEKRAQSLRESLVSAGLMAEQIHTLSYGEDHPADTGHDESAWAKNRRGEFILLKPKAGAGSSGTQ